MTSDLPLEEHNYRTASAGLASACERGDEEEVQFLLHAGVDVDTRFEVRDCLVAVAFPSPHCTSSRLHSLSPDNTKLACFSFYLNADVR
jgi:hypothetical protein